MDSFKRLSKFSNIEVVSDLHEPEKCKIIQIAPVWLNADKGSGSIVKWIVEYIEDKYLQDYYNEGAVKGAAAATAEDNAAAKENYEELLETILHKDPKGGTFNDTSLGDILANGKKGRDWLIWAKTNLKNPFIRDKVIKICEVEGL